MPKYVSLLEKLGILTLGDMLRHIPFRYEDYSQISTIDSVTIGEVSTIIGEIVKLKTIRAWKKKMFITEAFLEDESGSIRATWFNQPFLMNTLAEGKEIRVSGKISSGKSGIYFSNPAWEFSRREPTNTGRLVPVYPETDGLSSKWLRWQLQNIFQADVRFDDPLPETILQKLKLPPLEKALRFIHFPETENQYLLARKRFAFEEMFLLQLRSIQMKSRWQQEHSVSIHFDESLIKQFTIALPFTLTNAQRKAAFQILKDLEKNHPMNRLLNGDVGSGKTIVAAIASLQAAAAGFQVAIMAPTEVLARQHFLTFSELLKNHALTIALLTNAYQEKNEPQTTGHKSQTIIKETKSAQKTNLLTDISSGEINLVIGTHALIQKSVKFKNLALIIVDEQHRFGVTQRAYLQQEITSINDGLPGKIPHFLTMTATPIPRTLSLAYFGNLDLSLLDEMPKNRKPIITEIISPGRREKIYDFIRQEIHAGRQVFVILPLVEESKVLTEVKAATREFERLSKTIFPNLNIGLVHGKLKSTEKEKAMWDFANQKTDILVATAVVEVGIDIPNASVMIIEDADRFGLSQLHQFRGRIGRGQHQSYCFLFTSASGSASTARLKALVESENGFKIAEKDLELRGPGEFFGTRQSGLPDIAMENLTNVKLITLAHEEAQQLLSRDPRLKKHPLLAKRIRTLEINVHQE